MARTLEYRVVMFQFRHGAIKTVMDEDGDVDTRGFNSDTVRSKL